jgi:hypothetical protein
MNKPMIFSALALVVVTLLGVGLYRASQLMSLQLVNSVTIKGDAAKTYDMVRYLSNFPKWSPFLAQDPTIQYSVKGTDGTVGAQYHWNGNGGKDLGFQEIVKVEPNFVGMQCDIQKPFVAKPTFDYSFRQTPEGVEVTQDFRLQSGLVDAFFLWAFGAKKNMDATNKQGLELLKKAVEQG